MQTLRAGWPVSSRIRSSASRPTTSSAENQTVTSYLTESAGCSATVLVLNMPGMRPIGTGATKPPSWSPNGSRGSTSTSVGNRTTAWTATAASTFNEWSSTVEDLASSRY